MQFGTSGLRGLVTDMTDETVAAHVAAFLRHLRIVTPIDAVLVGRDRRPSSRRIAAAACAAVAGARARAIDCGVLPTPALALEAARVGAPAVMVTGSHIPFDRNGLKFYRPDGEITKADEAGILAALGAPVMEDCPPLREKGAGARYVERCLGFFGARRLAGLTVGVYEHSAAGRDLLGRALAGLGATVLPLRRTKGFVAIDTEAIEPAEAARLRRWAREHRLDAIVSTDGDGDRPVVADAEGRLLRGDVIGALAARALGADAVAVPLNATTAIERSGWFARVVRTRIGSPYVIEAVEGLLDAGAVLPVGFEGNGGFLLGAPVWNTAGGRLEALPTRDALLPILALLASAADAHKGVAALAAALPPRYTASARLPAVTAARSGRLLAGLSADTPARATFLAGLGAAVAVDRRDGVRITLAGGDVVHLRASGNAPELRAYAESGTTGRAEDLAAMLIARAAERLGR